MDGSGGGEIATDRFIKEYEKTNLKLKLSSSKGFFSILIHEKKNIFEGLQTLLDVKKALQSMVNMGQWRSERL